MRKQVFISISIIIICLLVDQITKKIAIDHLEIHKNYGVILGFLSNSSTLFRVVTLSTFSAFLIFIYSVLLYLLPKSLFFLKVSLSLILSGVLGNTIDKLVRYHTIDFIPLNIGNFYASCNVADIFLWSGTLYFFYAIFKHENKIWHPDNSRSTYLVNPREQLRLALKFLLISIFTSTFLGVFCMSFLQSLHYLEGNKFYEFLVIYSVLGILFSISTFLIGVIISHKSAGPLYAFELYVEKLLSGKLDDRFVLRDGDNYKHLEALADKLRSHLNKK